MRFVFFNFSKKINSTKQASGGAVEDVFFKNQTDFNNPQITLRSATKPTYNYCYDTGSRTYYFIDKIEAISANLYLITCRQDLMATNKELILNSRQYVTRSKRYDNVQDLFLPDDKMVMSQRVEWLEHSATTKTFSSIRDGYLLSLATNDEANSLKTYYLEDDEMLAFVNQLIDEDFFTQFKTAWGVSPIDAVRSCYLTRINPDLLMTKPNGSISFYGRVYDNITGSELLDRNISFYETISFDDQDAFLTDYTYLEPYTTHSLFIPCAGIYPIDLQPFFDKKTIHLHWVVDSVTNDGFVETQTDNGTGIKYTAESFNIQPFVPIELNKISSPVTLSGLISTGKGLVDTAMNVLTKNYLGAVGSLATTANSMLGHRTITKNGVIGSSANELVGTSNDVIGYTRIISRRYTPCSERFEIETKYGYPIMKICNMRELYGYTECDNAVLESGELKREEIEEIQNIMNTGFYIE